MMKGKDKTLGCNGGCPNNSSNDGRHDRSSNEIEQFYESE